MATAGTILDYLSGRKRKAEDDDEEIEYKIHKKPLPTPYTQLIMFKKQNDSVKESDMKFIVDHFNTDYHIFENLTKKAWAEYMKVKAPDAPEVIRIWVFGHETPCPEMNGSRATWAPTRGIVRLQLQEDKEKSLWVGLRSLIFELNNGVNSAALIKAFEMKDTTEQVMAIQNIEMRTAKATILLLNKALNDSLWPEWIVDEVLVTYNRRLQGIPLSKHSLITQNLIESSRLATKN